MPDVNELIRERAELLARVEEINRALAALGDPTRPVLIRTSKNLRNTWLEDVLVYADETLTVLQSTSSHEGWIPAASLAVLETKLGRNKNVTWWVD